MAQVLVCETVSLLRLQTALAFLFPLLMVSSRGSTTVTPFCQSSKLQAIIARPNSALPSTSTTAFAFTLAWSSLHRRHRPQRRLITRCLPPQLQRPSTSVSVCRLYRLGTLLASLHATLAFHTRARRRAQLHHLRPIARAVSGARGARPEDNHLNLRVRYPSARCLQSPHTTSARTSARNCFITRGARAPV